MSADGELQRLLRTYARIAALGQSAGSGTEFPPLCNTPTQDRRYRCELVRLIHQARRQSNIDPNAQRRHRHEQIQEALAGLLARLEDPPL